MICRASVLPGKIIVNCYDLPPGIAITHLNDASCIHTILSTCVLSMSSSSATRSRRSNGSSGATCASSGNRAAAGASAAEAATGVSSSYSWERPRIMKNCRSRYFRRVLAWGHHFCESDGVCNFRCWPETNTFDNLRGLHFFIIFPPFWKVCSI